MATPAESASPSPPPADCRQNHRDSPPPPRLLLCRLCRSVLPSAKHQEQAHCHCFVGQPHYFGDNRDTLGCAGLPGNASSAESATSRRYPSLTARSTARRPLPLRIPRRCGRRWRCGAADGAGPPFLFPSFTVSGRGAGGCPNLVTTRAAGAGGTAGGTPRSHVCSVRQRKYAGGSRQRPCCGRLLRTGSAGRRRTDSDGRRRLCGGERRRPIEEAGWWRTDHCGLAVAGGGASCSSWRGPPAPGSLMCPGGFHPPPP